MIKSLYKEFQKWSEDGSVYIISDPHFDDEDTTIMNPNWPNSMDYVNMLNKTIHKNDTLICLGDCGDLSYFGKLKVGYKVLIKGNHDDKGDSVYQRQDYFEQYKKSSITKNDLYDKMTKEHPNCKITIIDGLDFTLDLANMWVVNIDNVLFDEVYSGPLFISNQILLSHEPINGLSFCCNIHGHCHNGTFEYIDDFGGKHMNLAADVVDWKVFELNKMIKNGLTSKIPTIHRLCIDKATENPIHKNN